MSTVASRWQHRLALAAALLAVLVLAARARASDLTSTVLQECVRRPGELDCTDLLRVGLTVVGDQSVIFQTLAGDPPGPIVFEVSKRPTSIVYPLVYLHTVPYSPADWPAEPLVFDGYEILASSRSYRILVKMVQGEPPNIEVHEFELAPDNRLYNSLEDEDYEGAVAVRAELVGDLAHYTGVRELANYILYIPSAPATDPFVMSYREHMLLVPREEVTRDGTECNKVGATRVTILSPYGAAGRRPAYCFNNQLVHKYSLDKQRLVLDPDHNATYLVPSMREFDGAELVSGDTKYLVHQVRDSTGTRLALTLEADAVTQVVINESDAMIWTAEVTEFASMSRQGEMVVQIFNQGGLEADYIVGVRDCNANVNLPKPWRTTTVKAGDKKELRFEIYTTENVDASNQCTVVLKSPTGRVYDSLDVVFDTEEYQALLPWRLLQTD